MMTQIKIGSKWKSIDCTFVVTGVVEKDNHTWIYYKNFRTGQEYSCYQESFEHRFAQILNEN